MGESSGGSAIEAETADAAESSHTAETTMIARAVFLPAGPWNAQENGIAVIFILVAPTHAIRSCPASAIRSVGSGRPDDQYTRRDLTGLYRYHPLGPIQAAVKVDLDQRFRLAGRGCSVGDVVSAYFDQTDHC